MRTYTYKYYEIQIISHNIISHHKFWLRICLLMPAPWVLSLAQELGSQVPWGNSGNAPQTTEPKHSRPHAPEQEKPLQLEARTQLESKPSLTPTRESPCTTMKTQSSQTQNAYNLKNNNDHGNDNSWLGSNACIHIHTYIHICIYIYIPHLLYPFIHQ